MRRRFSRQDRLTALLAAVVLGLAAIGVWAVTHPARTPGPEAPGERAMRQIRSQLGPEGELRYAEDGQKRSVCGYVGRRQGGPAVGFVSTSTRILFSDDPLPVEFAEMRERYCPGFLTRPPTR